jgi:hypothetical protein
MVNDVGRVYGGLTMSGLASEKISRTEERLSAKGYLPFMQRGGLLAWRAFHRLDAPALQWLLIGRTGFATSGRACARQPKPATCLKERGSPPL